MAGGEHPVQMVVVGAAAGGSERVSQLLDGLPPDFPAPILLAQHAGPGEASQPAEVLDRRVPLAVRTLAGTETLQPGTVYVVPPGASATFVDMTATLDPDDTAGPTPSIDRLLARAAAAYGEGLVAVILSGTGPDGAAGARAVSARGGSVVVEKPAGAPSAGLPQSLAPSTVDVMVGLDRLAALLVSLVRVDALAGSPSGYDLHRLLEQVRAHSGIDFNGYKRPTIERRLLRRMAATDTTSLAAYGAYLDAHPEEYQRLVATFLIKVTDFFRDAETYECLRDVVVPSIIARARSFGNEIRLWSAGCATGEEAYSLAIVLCEALADELEAFHIRIFATDVDADAVAFARHGIYPESALAQLGPDLVARYFRHEDGRFVASKRLRSLIVFGQHDLGHRPPFPRTDLILCRNVLIYFAPAMQERALELFAYSLRAGGYLVLGKAETVAPASEFFLTDNPALKVYRRANGSVPIPAVRAQVAIGHDARPTWTPVTRAAVARRPEGSASRRHASAERLADMAFRIPVGIAIVDAHYDIAYINGAARDFLEIRAGAIGRDLVHLARGLPPNLLLGLIDDATVRGLEGRVSGVVLDDAVSGRRRVIDITCRPLPAAGEPPTRLAAVVISDVTGYAERAERLERQVAQEREAREAASARLAPLDAALRELTAANAELTAHNAVMRAANAAVAAGHEAAQAASEEVETLNEELQVSNEELETLNEELQATVEELHASNEDMQVRNVQMQELAAAREAQHRQAEEARERLEVVLASMPLAVLVVDRDGETVTSNAAGQALLERIREPELRDTAGRLLEPAERPRQRAARGESFRMAFTFADGEEMHWYEAIGNPLLHGETTVAHAPAAVLAIHDTTDSALRELQWEFLATAGHELRTPLTAISLYVGMLARQVQDADQRRLVDDIVGELGRFRRLVGDLTDSVRLQGGDLTLRREAIDLVALLRRTVLVAQHVAAAQPVRLEVPEDEVRVSADPTRLEQILMNVIDNAIRHAPSSPRIDVRLRRVAGSAEIEVEDQGPGIPASELPRLFTRFYRSPDRTQRGHRGLGLGLYIVRNLVTAHGGEVTVRSAEGEGTVFTIRLPLAT